MARDITHVPYNKIVIIKQNCNFPDIKMHNVIFYSHNIVYCTGWNLPFIFMACFCKWN